MHHHDAPAPVEVTRYHLGQPMERTTRRDRADERRGADQPRISDLCRRGRAELERLGYVQSRSSMASGYIAGGFVHARSRGAYREQPPVSIGLGGGGISGGRRGGGVGLGGGVSFGIGGKTREVYGSELAVQLRRAVTTPP
jgi:hypothetical protein